MKHKKGGMWDYLNRHRQNAFEDRESAFDINDDEGVIELQDDDDDDDEGKYGEFSSYNNLMKKWDTDEYWDKKVDKGGKLSKFGGWKSYYYDKDYFNNPDAKMIDWGIECPTCQTQYVKKKNSTCPNCGATNDEE